ncbi:hypothetical protein APP_36860 [Aeribacillus pallidus]|nr:hypothetical protein APP_36860 [Aeribacillus pallidus]
MQDILDFYEEVEKTINPPNYFEWNTYRVFKKLGSYKNLVPNFKLDDSGHPIGNAIPGVEDILVEYEHFSILIECSLTIGEKQLDYEGDSVVRHLQEYKKKGIEAYTLFLGKSIDLSFARHIGFNKESEPVIPLTVDQFKKLVTQLKGDGEHFNPNKLKEILIKLLRSDLGYDQAEEWLTH